MNSPPILEPIFSGVWDVHWGYPRVLLPFSRKPRRSDVKATSAVSQRQAASWRGEMSGPLTLARSSSRRLEYGYQLFSVVYFSRGTLPEKKGKTALLGNLVGFQGG